MILTIFRIHVLALLLVANGSSLSSSDKPSVLGRSSVITDIRHVHSPLKLFSDNGNQNRRSGQRRKIRIGRHQKRSVNFKSRDWLPEQQEGHSRRKIWKREESLSGDIYRRSVREEKRMWKRDQNLGPLPEIVTKSTVVRVKVGDRATLRCEVTSLGKYVVMWKQGKRVMTAGNLTVRKDDRVSLKSSGNTFNLEISPVSLSDSGNYTCEVDVLGRPLAKTHTLEVLVSPQVQAKESNVRLRKGQNHTLRCAAMGHPNPRITWKRENGHLSGGLYEKEGLSLELVDVTRHDAGNYICIASNGVGDPAEAFIEVSVQYPPEIEMEQNWYGTETGIEVEIDCIVHSAPPPQVAWYKNGNKLFETDRLLMTEKPSRWSLKLLNLGDKDFGNFSCRAENALGKTRAYNQLNGTPQPPKFTSPNLNFHVGVYNLTWRIESFSPILELKLMYRIAQHESQEHKSDSETGSTQDSGVWSEVLVPVPYLDKFATSFYYTMRQLRTGAVYDVIGRAKNKYGWSAYSNTFTFFNKGVDYSTRELASPNGETLLQDQEKKLVVEPPSLSVDLTSSTNDVPKLNVILLSSVLFLWMILSKTLFTNAEVSTR